ncbi:MAG: hypothetical protein LBP29_00940 [Treponema sp.]|jgi:hypothetical protein|nr:hypothetical protein [Treponema sp.]
MKKAIVSMLAAVLVFAGCTSKPPAVSDPDMPPWVNEQPPEGLLWGIGVSSNAQQNMRLTMADAAARQDLARQLQVLAQGMVTDYAREAGGIDDTAAIQFQETVSRQIAQANLQGAVRDLVWTTPDKKTLWIRLRLSKADAARTTADQAQKAIDSESARYAEFKAMDALKMMEQQIDRNSTSPQPVIN